MADHRGAGRHKSRSRRRGSADAQLRGRFRRTPPYTFHAFRKACWLLLLAHGKSLKQVQGWLRHSQLTTTMNVYIHQVDDGLGSADAWDEILGDARTSTPHDQPAAHR